MKDKLLLERKNLMAECDALKGTDGKFATDEARASFDTKMARVDAIDAEVRALDAAPPSPADAATEAARAAGATAERQRSADIRVLARTHKLETLGEELVAKGVTVEDARKAILDKLAGASGESETRQHTSITAGEDQRDKWLRGAANWLLVRAGKAAMVAKHMGTTADKLDPGEFRGLHLIDLARESLDRNGVSTRGMRPLDIVGKAFTHRSGNYQTTSDFATLLENVMHKVLQASYGITPDTWSRWCGVATVTDFRTHKWYRTGSLTALDALNEQGEFKSKNIPDAETASHSIATKGNIVGISREVIINDDLGFVMRLMEALGRAGKLTIEKAAYALLAQNSGLGPTQADTHPLFYSTRSNVGAGAALSAAAIDANRVIMARQMDVNGVDYLGLAPAILLVPTELGGQGRVINESQYDPDTVANKSQMKPNFVRGIFRDVVDTPRLSGTRRYLFADPSLAPVFVVSFLEGQQEPVLETQNGWEFNGVEMKARLDVGVDAIDYRGAVTDAGA